MRHPYFPIDLELPGYAAPAIPFQQVLAYFFAACGTLFAITWLVTGAADSGTNEIPPQPLSVVERAA